MNHTGDNDERTRDLDDEEHGWGPSWESAFDLPDFSGSDDPHALLRWQCELPGASENIDMSRSDVLALLNEITELKAGALKRLDATVEVAVTNYPDI